MNTKSRRLLILSLIAVALLIVVFLIIPRIQDTTKPATTPEVPEVSSTPEVAEASPEVSSTPEVVESSPEASSTPEATPEVTEAAPQEQANFFAELKLTDLKGDPFDASVFKGKPAFINIWATWCSPCISEMPHLDELAKEYADKITIIGLHAEGMNVKNGELVPWQEKNEAAVELVEKLGLTFPIINPDQNLFVLMMSPDYGLQVSAYPTTWLIDENGSVASIVPGSRDKAEWQTIIDGFLKYLEEKELEKDEG